MKLPMFHGNGTNDLEQYWFLCEAVQMVRQTTNEDVNKSQLATTLQGHVFDWYMRFIQVMQGIVTKTFDEIWKRLLDEFKKPKYEAQYITELKEIKKFPNEMVWDFDQRFKTLMAWVIFDMSDIQHK